jgi:hypothetical protein
MSAVATRGGVGDLGDARVSSMMRRLVATCAVPVGTVSDLEESCRADG